MERLSVLIVDDEEDLVLPLAERLAIRGLQADVATNGTDALRRVEEDDFSVLVLDVKMPGIHGLELLTEIRQKRPELPIILFTGHGSVADAERGMLEGACDYLVKPIDIDRLIEKIRSAAGRKKGHVS